MTVIPHSRPSLGPAERAAVLDAVGTGWVGSGGPHGEALRHELSTLLGRPDCALVASGTIAIELSLRSLGVTGGRVAIPAYACRSIQRAVLRAGARPTLVDVQSHDLAIGEEGLASVRREVDAAVLVHQFGIVSRYARDVTNWDLPVIEDVTTVVGILKPALSPPVSLAVMSMGATKPLCGGEGGAVLGRSDLVGNVAELACAESAVSDDACATQAGMPDVCAAIARVQLSKQSELAARRRAIAHTLIEVTDRLGLRVLGSEGRYAGSWWRFLIDLGGRREPRDVVNAARERDVVFAQPVAEPWWRAHGHFPIAEYAWESLLSIPVHASLTDGDVDRISRLLCEVLGGQPSRKKDW